jgi:exonuclease III
MLNTIIRDCGAIINDNTITQDKDSQPQADVDTQEFPPRDYASREEPPRLWEFDWRDRYKKQEKRPAVKPPAEPDDFQAQYDELTAHQLKPDPYMLTVPHSIETWNVDGLEPRLKNNLPDMHLYACQVNKRQPSMIFIQEVRLRCHTDQGHGVVHPQDERYLTQLLELLPAYEVQALSLATKKYSGQLMLLRRGVQTPHLSYTFSTTSQSHDREGRIIVAEFKDLVVLATYTPCTGRLSRESLLRRRSFEKNVLKFVTNHQTVTIKPLIYCGDLNATLNESDTNQPIDYWCTTALVDKRTPFQECEVPDYSFPGTSYNERRALQEIILRGKLMDPGDEPHRNGESHFTWRGHPRSAYGRCALRLDYILPAIALNDAGCLRKYVVNARGSDRRGFFGSDHSPVLLQLHPDWHKRLQLSQITTLLVKQKEPQWVVKGRDRQRSVRARHASAPSTVSKVGVLQTLFLATLFMAQIAAEPPPKKPPDDHHLATHRSGSVLLAEGRQLEVEALFDTGCQNANYISGTFVERNIEELKPLLRSCSATVFFGDRTAKSNITQQVDLRVQFTRGDTVRAEVCRFLVLPGNSCDLIIGTPTIFTSFSDVFLDLIKSAVWSFSGPSELSEPALDSISYKHLAPPAGAEYPWATEIDLEAPEDAEIPEASSFGPSVLNFLTQSVDKEREKYEQFISTNVDQGLLDAGGARDVLREFADCFVKEKWEGLNIPPVEFEFVGLPERMKPKQATIPDQLVEDTKKEFSRLCTYFFVKCDSPWASPLTVAPKATDPFIRLCINLMRVNKHLRYGHTYIPHVQHTIQKLKGFKYFLDIDARNGYHQVPLAEETSKRLSVQTPWGQFRPVFMPEGVCCGTAVFQRTMMDIFDPLNDGCEEKWCFVLHDNFLIGSHSHADSVDKLRRFLQRARDKNVYLKMEKTHLGHVKQHFFGYDIEDGGYSMSPDRSKALEKVPFPSGKPAVAATEMRSFLGQTRIFAPHVADYTAFSGPLDEMTSKNFDWDTAVWKRDYRAIFEQFKARLKQAMKLFYPDHEKDWVLRTDASSYGYGGVLYQTYVNDTGDKVYEPLKFMSKKFSDPATRWDTFTQECYAIFACIKETEYLLRGKAFIIETDHNNLLWLEQSAVPKIIRQHLYIRSFVTWIRHVAGKANTADYWSRLVCADPSAAPVLAALFAAEADDQEMEPADAFYCSVIMTALDKFTAKHGTPTMMREDGSLKTPEDLLRSVHGGTFLHHGVRRTWLMLNEIYPGHRIPLRTITEFVESCAVCQKHKQGLRDTIKPYTRVLKPESHRHTIGIDTVDITPHSEDGHQAIVTIVNHHTHFVYLHPVKTHSARDVCGALMAYIGNFGLVDEVKSDPGSDLLSKAVTDLNKWLGLRHVVSLVDVHTSNGCENTNRLVIKHLRALVADFRLKQLWSDPMLIKLVQFHMNSLVSSEAGLAPFVAMFGSADETYFKLDPNIPLAQLQTEYVKLLDKNLTLVREVSAQHQAAIVEERTAGNQHRNQYAVGDLVLKVQRTPTKPWLPEKIGPEFLGPWRVTAVHANDYTVVHVVTGAEDVLHVDMLKPFFGTDEEAYDAALEDGDQHVVTAVTHYIGDPTARRHCEFKITYADGDQRWVVWSYDLVTCAPFQAFCKEHPELWQFLHTKSEANRLAIACNRDPIKHLDIGDTIYVDLRAIGAHWYYQEAGLPDTDTATYVAEFRVMEFTTRACNRVRVMSPLLEVFLDWTHSQALMWGSLKELAPAHTLVTPAHLEAHPSINRSLLAHHKAYHKLLAYKASRAMAGKPTSEGPVKKRGRPFKDPAAAAAASAPSKTVKFASPTPQDTGRRSSARLRGGKR